MIMKIRYQSLSSHYGGKHQGRYFIYTPGNSFQFSYHLGWVGPSMSVCFSAYDDYDIVVNVGVPLLGDLFICVKNAKWVRRFLARDENSGIYYHRQVGFSTTATNCILFYPWSDPWGLDTEKRSTIVVNLASMILGKQLVSEGYKVIYTDRVQLPEGKYKCTIKRRKITTRRSRLPEFFKKEHYKYDIVIPGGIPIPGKGDNSWDTGDDSILSMSARCDSEAELKQMLVDSVMSDRIKCNSKEWVPDGGWPEHLQV